MNSAGKTKKNRLVKTDQQTREANRQTNAESPIHSVKQRINRFGRRRSRRSRIVMNGAGREEQK